MAGRATHPAGTPGRPLRRGRLRLIIALFASCALFFSAAPNASALSPHFYGMDLGQDSFDSTADWKAMQTLGVDMVHMQFEWSRVVQHGWANSYDRYIRKATERGQQILPYLYGRKNGSSQHYAVVEPEIVEFESFVAEAVQRYGYDGSFWQANPDLPYRPLWVWEVWNEPNLNNNSPGNSANGAVYAKFLKETYLTIDAAETSPEPTVVLFGGIYQGGDRGIGVTKYLQEAKESGIGVASYFNALSSHPYGFGVEGKANSESARLQSLQTNIQTARTALTNLCTACSGKTLWLTEFGWGVGTRPLAVSASEQSSLLWKSYDWISGAAPSLGIEHAAWYLYKDTADPSWAGVAGLRDGNGFLRPAWCTYAAVTASSCVIPYNWYSDNLGGVNTSDADISSWGPGRFDIFARGSDGYLWHKYWNYGSWSGWEKMAGPPIVGGPSSVSWSNGRIDVVARTNDANNTLTHWYWNGSSWAYDNLGGVNTSDPDIASWGGNRLDVFARGSDGKLWHRYWNYGSWGPWESRGGPTIVGGPGAVSWDLNRIDVVARTGEANNPLGHWYWNGSWGYDNLGGVNTSDPDIASTGPNNLEIFARGSDSNLWRKTWNGWGWSGWTSLGGPVVGGPGAVSWDEGVAWDGDRIDVIARSTDANASLAHWFWLP